MSTISDAFNKKKQNKQSKRKSLADEYPALLDKKRDHRKLWAVLLLVIALVCGGGGGYLLFSFLGKEKADVNAEPVKEQIEATEQEQEPETAEQFPELKLEGTISDQFNPQAIVNGRILSVGNEIDGARIEGIYDWGIVVEFQGTRKEIRKP
jgi:cytoskeletal protein RodZ